MKKIFDFIKRKSKYFDELFKKKQNEKIKEFKKCLAENSDNSLNDNNRFEETGPNIVEEDELEDKISGCLFEYYYDRESPNEKIINEFKEKNSPEEPNIRTEYDNLAFTPMPVEDEDEFPTDYEYNYENETYIEKSIEIF